MAYLAGKETSVLVGGVVYPFGRTKIGLKAALPKCTNYTSGGFQELLTAIFDGTLTTEALTYKRGSMPLTVGGTYTMVVNLDAVFAITMTVKVQAINLDSDVEGAVPISVDSLSTGAFTLSIV